VTQASFWWQQLRSLIQGLPMARIQSRVIRPISRKKLRKISGWLLGAITIVAMLLWNWKLVLATSSGVGLMMLIYVMQGWNWQAYWLHWRRYLTESNRKLTVAVGSGGIAALTTYIAASIWVDSENRWLATGSILQGFGTLLTLVLLSWQMVGHQNKQTTELFDELLMELTGVDPLKRLIAVRQLTNLARKARCNPLHRSHLVEYFRLMLSVEQEPIVRKAILDGLQLWEKRQLSLQEDRSWPIPVNLERSPKTIYR
jgi:hypothetical protein